MKLYSDIGHYDPAYRSELADLLKPYWNDISDEERRQTYGPQVDQYRMVEAIDDADLCVLPMSWNFYYRTGQLGRARDFVEHTRRHGKEVATWVTGDFGVTVPVEDVHIFRASGYRSRRAPLQHAVPVFIRDPVEEAQALTVRAKAERPVIGFCGQASDTPVAKLVKPLQIAARNIQYHVGLSHHEPQALYPATFLRARVLDLLEKSEAVQTRFTKHKKYKGGTRPGTQVAEALRKAFWDNIAGTDYTVCVRGSGNFSARFYEVLAMGRIPLFIDTDCLLPYEDAIDWDAFCVRVEVNDLSHLPEKVAAFHDQLDAEAFVALQKKCRQLWEDRLSFSGFFTHFPEHFRCTIKIP